MRKVFINRAKRRSVVAYILLTIALVLITLGIVLAFYLIIDWSMKLGKYSLLGVANHPEPIAKLEIEINKISTENLKYKYTVITVVLLSMIFFISQTLLRLYRYNMLKADFYFACADSFILTQKFSKEEQEKFQTFLTTIISEKISLTTPKTPSFSVFGSTNKGAG